MLKVAISTGIWKFFILCNSCIKAKYKTFYSFYLFFRKELVFSFILVLPLNFRLNVHNEKQNFMFSIPNSNTGPEVSAIMHDGWCWEKSFFFITKLWQFNNSYHVLAKRGKGIRVWKQKPFDDQDNLFNYNGMSKCKSRIHIVPLRPFVS